jgi:TonB family protein
LSLSLPTGECRPETSLAHELLRLPISFHPATWLIRSGIERTREMACDELTAPQAIRVETSAQQAKLLNQQPPAYPPLARQARISGVVHLAVLIGKDGKVRDLTVLSGHPLLAPAAMQAVKEWAYRPTLIAGDPVEVLTTVDVNFDLNQIQ